VNRQPAVSFGDAFERIQPVIAIVLMAVTFPLLSPPLAIPFIGLAWLVATRLSPRRRFLGLTLAEGLAWAATIYSILVGLVIVLSSLGAR
jgi:hypothetical protein